MSFPAPLLRLIVALAIPVLLANCSTNTGQTAGTANAAQAAATETSGPVSVESTGIDEASAAALVTPMPTWGRATKAASPESATRPSPIVGEP